MKMQRVFAGVLAAAAGLCALGPSSAFADADSALTSVANVRTFYSGTTIWVQTGVSAAPCNGLFKAENISADGVAALESVALAGLLSGRPVGVYFDNATCKLTSMYVK